MLIHYADVASPPFGVMTGRGPVTHDFDLHISAKRGQPNQRGFTRP
jgi:hypothetical protein